MLNELWGFGRSRSWLRRVTDYVTLVVVTPMLVLVAVTFGAAAQSSQLAVFLRERLGLGSVIDFLLRFTSFLGACVAVTALLLIMPNGKVRTTSALIGGLVGGVLWQVALIVHVNLQVGVARYNALYAGFGAFPIFLVWVYVSWVTVLFGAELASSHQNEQMVRQRVWAREIDQALEEALGLMIVARATCAFLGLGEGARPSLASLAAEIGAPAQTIERVAQALAAGGALAVTDGDGEPTFLPGKDIDALRVSDLLTLLRHRTRRPQRGHSLELAISPAVAGILSDLGRAERDAGDNVTARELAARVAGSGAGAGSGSGSGRLARAGSAAGSGRARLARADPAARAPIASSGAVMHFRCRHPAVSCAFWSSPTSSRARPSLSSRPSTGSSSRRSAGAATSRCWRRSPGSRGRRWRAAGRRRGCSRTRPGTSGSTGWT